MENKNMKAIILLLSIFTVNLTVLSQWVQTGGTPEGGGVTDMVVTSNGTIIVACASFNWPTVQGGIRHSTNSGTTWVNDFQHYTARTLALGQNGYVFASSWDFPANNSEGLWVSTNNGETWGNYRYLVGQGNNIFSILVKDNNQTVYLGTRTGILKSTDGGFGYISVNNGIPANSWVRDLEAKNDGSIYAATTNGVFRSTNSGSSWQQFSGITPGDTVVKLCIYDPGADAGSGKVIGGTNNGKAYEEGAELFLASFFIANNTNEVSGLEALGTAIFMCQFNEGGQSGDMHKFYQSNGWQYVGHNEGLPGTRPISSLAADPTPRLNSMNVQIYLGYYEGTSGGAKVFKRTFPIGIRQISSEIPNEFSLSQNYPNPFNPMTKIKFDINKTSNVNITVFDVLGRHITTLVDDRLSAGSYETQWDATNMPSGTYFYRLETDDFTETKKMILVK
jgi:hypothetical protein